MEVKIIRSSRRTKTVSARVVKDVVEISAPMTMSDAELAPIVTQLQQRLAKKQRQKSLDNSELHLLACKLNQQYFQNQLSWTSIVWSLDQEKIFGSCTPSRQTLRISHRIATMPSFVQEYVVMHELTHLLEANHGPHFWELVNRYPYTERARGYLMAVGLEGLQETPEDIL